MSQRTPLGLSEEQLYSELYLAWLKDIRERATPETLKQFRDVVDKGIKDKEISLPKERVGINFCVALSTMLARTPIVKLDLYHNLVRDAGCEAIAQLVRDVSSFQVLNLGGNDIGLPGIQALSLAVAGHKKMHTLLLGTERGDSHLNRIDSQAAKVLFEGCLRSKTLKCLDVSRNPIGKTSQEPFRILQQFIVQSNCIHTLKLANTSLSTESALLLVQGVAKNSTLAYLDLSSNDLSSTVGEALGKIIRDRSVKSTPSALKTLILANNSGLGDRGGVAIFRSLMADKGLNVLNMKGCSLTDDSIIALCESLNTNAALQQLDLSSNGVCERGAMELSRAILPHPAMKTISLAHNKIKDDGVCAFASMIEGNKVVEILDFENCWVADRGIIALGVALATNTTLSTLRLNNNHITDDGGNAFVALLNKNRSLQHCGLNGNNIFHCTIMHCAKITDRNRQLKQDELPSRLRKEIIKLHYQMYKLEEAKIELENQRGKKFDIDKTQEKFEAQFRQEEADFRRRQKELLEKHQEKENEIQNCEIQAKAIVEQFQRTSVSLEAEIVVQKERLEAETKDREKLEEDLKRLQGELDNAETLRAQRFEELKKKIADAETDREHWITQAKEYKAKVEEAQLKVRELETKAAAQAK